MYMPAYAGNPRNPLHPVDFVDFVDIFRRASNHAGLLNCGPVDILWIFSWMWIYPWIVLLRVQPPNTFQNGNSSEIHDRSFWIWERPTFSRKKKIIDGVDNEC